MEERKLTLRNHIELFADELCEVGTKLDTIIDDIKNTENEWIDDEIVSEMEKLLKDVLNAGGNAWELENRLHNCTFGERRF